MHLLLRDRLRSVSNPAFFDHSVSDTPRDRYENYGISSIIIFGSFSNDNIYFLRNITLTFRKYSVLHLVIFLASIFSVY